MNDFSNIICTSGCFDRLHKGHLRLLHAARDFADTGYDYVFVLLNSDEYITEFKKRVPQPFEKRAAALFLTSYVDSVIKIYQPEDILKNLRPSLFIVGDDYKDEDIRGREYIKTVVKISKIPGISTTGLVKGENLI